MAVSVEVNGLSQVFPDGVFMANCPSRVVLDHVTSKWGVLVLVSLQGRTLRWGELRRSVEGVSEKMLAQTLKTFERDGLVARLALPVIPPHVEYSLTARGDELVDLLRPLLIWVAANAEAILSPPVSPSSPVSSPPPASPSPSISPSPSASSR